MGDDSVMLSTDYPYEDIDVSEQWIETANVSSDQRLTICRSNAQRILGIEC